MFASHRWLMELSGLDVADGEVAERLTAAGIEVEATRRVGEGLGRTVVAEVRGSRPHPKRDKLRLVTVFDGAAEHEIVCGAPNVPGAGGKVVLAQLGASLPGGLEITERELGGVISRGMLCSERELGLGTDESGILVLDSGSDAVLGTPAVRALAAADTIFELSLTPNRADCLGHLGLARELCVLFGQKLTPPRPPQSRRIAASDALFPQSDARFVLELGDAAAATGTVTGFSPVRVDIRDGARCPRYGAALVSEVGVAPAPFWMRSRLHALGLRPISNVVDATNYVLMLFAHPIHAFDYDRVRGSRIEVRLARAGERMHTLDGVDRALSEDDLLICDGAGPVALAGVMGGENSEIGADTKRVLIECAYFDPRSVRRTSKRTGLHTDASHRFERGVDPGAVRSVLAYTAALIGHVTGGAVVIQALDAVAQAVPRPRIGLRLARAQALLGRAIDPARAHTWLSALGCEVSPSPQGFVVDAPSHRPDITREVDLIEELARLTGYDELPSVLPRLAASDEGTPEAITFLRRLREAAAAAGLDEAINFAFVAPADLPAARAPQRSTRVVNPLSEERSVLRTSLLPGLARNLRGAQSQQWKRFCAFELARVFTPVPGQLLPEQEHELGILIWGQRGYWYADGDDVDFYDGKAAVESVVRSLAGHAPETVEDERLDTDAPELHPKRRARVHLGAHAIGVLGELHPDVVRDLGLLGRPIWARLRVPALSEACAALGKTRARELPRFPSATRDLAVVVAEAIQAGEVAAVLREAGGPIVEAVTLFDLYRGDPVPAGHKSLAFRVTYRDPDSTLTDRAVDDLHAKLVRAAQQRFGASLRG